MEHLGIEHVITAAVAALGGALAAWLPRRSRTISKTETVDADVLGQFLALADKVTDLELDLAHAQARLQETAKELEVAMLALAKRTEVEKQLRLTIAERDKEIRSLRRLLQAHGVDYPGGLTDELE